MNRRFRSSPLLHAPLANGTRPCFVRPGFTLIEIMVVVLITAVLASAASLTLLHTNRVATLDDIVRRIEYLDAVTRHTACRSGNVQHIVLDLDTGTIRQTAGADASAKSDSNIATSEADSSQYVQLLHLPDQLRLERLWVAGASDKDQAGRNVTIPCSADGYTPTYALQIGGVEEKKRWIVLSGLGGQPFEATNEEQVEAILKILSPIESGGDHAP